MQRDVVTVERFYTGQTGALVSGLGGAVTEQPTARLWEMARLIRHSDKLRQLFSQGLASVAAQLESARNGEADSTGRAGNDRGLAQKAPSGGASIWLNSYVHDTFSLSGEQMSPRLRML